AISPASTLIDEMERLAEETPRQIANAHTLFNVINTLIFIWFTGPIAKIVQYAIPVKESESVTGTKEPRYLNECFLGTPALALDCLRMEVGEMGACVNDIYKAFQGVDKEAQEAAMLKAQEDVNALDRAILTFAHQIGSKELPAKYSTRLETLLGVTNDFQIICDIIVLHGTELSTKWDSMSLSDHAGPNTLSIMREHHKIVQGALSCAVAAIQDDDASSATHLSESVGIPAHSTRRSIIKRERLVNISTESMRLEVYRIESDIIELYKRIFYFSRRIAKTVTQDTTTLSRVVSRVPSAHPSEVDEETDGTEGDWDVSAESPVPPVTVDLNDVTSILQVQDLLAQPSPAKDTPNNTTNDNIV
ncbi:hypothetical protein KIPB_008609, partial [Kipferlia bialata]